MTALTVILKILSIIGIILLSILGLAVFLLGVVLFVPIHYKAKGSFHDKEPVLRANVHWLLGIVHLSYELKRKEPLIIRIFGIKLKKKEDKESSDFAQSNQTDDTYTATDTLESDLADTVVLDKSADAKETNETVIEPEKLQDAVIQGSQDACEQDEKTASADSDEQEASCDTSKKDRKPGKKGKEKSSSSTQKTSFYDKLKRYIDILQSEDFKKSFELGKKVIGKLFSHILPRKWFISASVSLKDPASTAKILEITSMLYPWIYKHIRISTDFSDEHIDVDGFAKGHITVFKILWLGAVLYFNKNIKKIIKLFKEV